MSLHFVYKYTRQDAKSYPSALFVFGDNMERRGKGGQASALRGEPNAVGIPTKWKPSRVKDAYFTDTDFPVAKPLIDTAFDVLEAHLRKGGEVYWPAAGIGSGLAELPKRAPQINSYINKRLLSLMDIASGG